MRIPALALLVAISLFPGAAAQAPVFELERLGAPGAAASDRLGDNVRLTSDWLVAGIPARTDTLTGEGKAVDGGRVLVGAFRQPNNGAFEGAAYAYESVGGVWTETGTFQVDPMTSDLGLGVSVAISGTTAVVGAARTNDPGAVYVYEDNGPGWTQVDRLQPTNLGASATFGHSVAIQGDRLIVGAYQDPVAANFSGSAWVFERDFGAWSPRVRLVQSGPSGFHGYSVDLDGAGDYVVGEPVGFLPGHPGVSGSIRTYRPDRPIGTSYCSSALNSTQRFGRVGAFGSEVATDDQVTLVAYQLPSNSFGYFITSRTQGMVNQPAGSQGILCLGGAIGRYVGAGQIRNSGQVRSFALPLDLSTTPTPNGLVQVVAGETWNFQAWYRDTLQGVPTSNFTDGISVGFL